MAKLTPEQKEACIKDGIELIKKMNAYPNSWTDISKKYKKSVTHVRQLCMNSFGGKTISQIRKTLASQRENKTS